jgi:hypothetical protein
MDSVVPLKYTFKLKSQCGSGLSLVKSGSQNTSNRLSMRRMTGPKIMIEKSGSLMKKDQLRNERMHTSRGIDEEDEEDEDDSKATKENEQMHNLF